MIEIQGYQNTSQERLQGEKVLEVPVSISREHEAFAPEVGGTGVLSCSQSWAVPEQQPKSPEKQQARDVSCASYTDVCSDGNSACLWFLQGDGGDQKN